MERVKEIIRTVPDFPQPGILFKDITTLLADALAFKTTIDGLADAFRGQQIDFVAGMEARGFIVGTPLALELGCGFIMLRKPSKLPGEKIRVSYGKEYGEDALEISAGILKPGQRVLVVDDLIATGGTAVAACQLVEKAGGVVAGCGFVVELSDLPGRQRLQELGYQVTSLVSYP